MTDHLLGHLLIAWTEGQVSTPCRRTGNPGCPEIHLPGTHGLENLAHAGGSAIMHIHPQRPGKALNHVMLGTAWSVAVLIEGGRRVAGEDAQFSALLNLRQAVLWGLTLSASGEQQDQSACQYSSIRRHSRQLPDNRRHNNATRDIRS